MLLRIYFIDGCPSWRTIRSILSDTFATGIDMRGGPAPEHPIWRVRIKGKGEICFEQLSDSVLELVVVGVVLEELTVVLDLLGGILIDPSSIATSDEDFSDFAQLFVTDPTRISFETRSEPISRFSVNSFLLGHLGETSWTSDSPSGTWSSLDDLDALDGEEHPAVSINVFSVIHGLQHEDHQGTPAENNYLDKIITSCRTDLLRWFCRRLRLGQAVHAQLQTP